MSEAAGLAVIETVALLLTLIFIAVQFASRHAALNRIDNAVLATTMERVGLTSIFLGLAAGFGALAVSGATDDHLTGIALGFLLTAFFFVSLEIYNTAQAIRRAALEEGSRFNTPGDQTTIEEFNE